MSIKSTLMDSMNIYVKMILFLEVPLNFSLMSRSLISLKTHSHTCFVSSLGLSASRTFLPD